MKLFIKITILLFLVCPSIGFGQTYFNMRYPPDSGTWGNGALAIDLWDSGYIMPNGSIDNIDGRSHIKTSKLKENGVFIKHSDSLHFTDRHIFVKGFKRTTNGYVQVSTIESYNPLRYQYGTIKYDINGIIISHNIDTTEYIYITDIHELVNKDLILVGNVQLDSTDIHKARSILIKTDSLGNKIWQKTYNFSGYEYTASSIALCNDGGFIIGGAETNYNKFPSFTKPLIIKVDSLGNVQWRRTYGSTDYGNRPAYGITQTQDGGFAFVGSVGKTTNVNYQDQIPWVVKLDSLGTILWSYENQNAKTLTPYPYDNDFKDIIELTDGSLVACGQQRVAYYKDGNLDEYGKRGAILKFSADGQKKWERYYIHPEAVNNYATDNNLYDIKPTPDGGFVAVGYLTPSIDTTQDTWVIKVDSFGCLVQGCEVTSVPKINASISALKIYPNPAQDVLYIEITPNLQSAQQEFVFELYDVLGKKVFAKTLIPFENTVNISRLKTGVYSYRIGETWGKIVKQF